MRNTANAGIDAFRQVSQLGIPITAPLVDNTPVGSFWCRVGITVLSTPTNIPIQLTRVPSGCITIRTSNGAVIFQEAADVAASSGSVFVCRATKQSMFTLLIG
jgi:hypothetical protein